MSAHKHPHDELILMIEHDAFENVFNRLCEETMILIEETAAYIDTEGKLAARSLPAEVSALYAKETVYLSTRLMQVASQLLLLRAEREGEMSPEQIQKETAKISLHTPSLSQETDHWKELPEIFRHFVIRSLRIEERMRYISYNKQQVSSHTLENNNPVNKQIQLLQTAFQRP
ncbi:DUF1465 family protein [Bartonella sp. A05]|uniref:DUF1465 family protein n=1 Tax=Bartonella sp. A05 TaxID=2967261 RepID=UPI0022A98C62|nr:DUF1465 family protein [Bartonella sp. A05]MCZ2203662.1 DUF1465 family protein [Bartonella sp. A05]